MQIFKYRETPDSPWQEVAVLQGPQGKQGERGIQGEQGIQGIQGIQGERGLQGERGIQGEQGIQGIQGERGPQGERGEKGDKPVVGVDYFTEEDKQEMINTIIASLEDGEEREF